MEMNFKEDFGTNRTPCPSLPSWKRAEVAAAPPAPQRSVPVWIWDIKNAGYSDP